MELKTMETKTGRYTYQAGRDMAAELAKADKRARQALRKPRSVRPTAPDVLTLAKRAAAMYQARHEAAGSVNIHVFKITGSENTNAARFRLWLAAYLTGHVVRGRYYGDTIDTCGYSRETLETWADKAGYHFIEVCPADWGLK